MERDWNSWDESPRTVEEHIEKYREKLAQKNVVSGEHQVAEPDYFGDMEPTTIKQAKYLIANPNGQQEKQDFSRLMASVGADIPITVGGRTYRVSTEKNIKYFSLPERIGGLGRGWPGRLGRDN